MAAFINTNTASLNAQRNLNTSQSSLTTSLQRLSSGLRINSAKDDAAGLAISERFTTQIRGISQAARNANDGISLSQTAEGAMGEIGNNLQRIRELAVQSRNATNSDSDRAALNSEATQLKAEIDRVAGQTSFNGNKLLDGSFTNQAFQVGANQGETINISGIVNASSASLGTSKAIGPVSVTGGNVAATAVTDLTVAGISVASTTPTADAAGAAAMAGAINTALTTGGNTDITASVVGTAVKLTSASGADIAVAGAAIAGSGLTAATTSAATLTGFAGLDISTVAGADAAMRSMDGALTAINSARANMGAIQNRFSSVVSNLQTTSENLSASRSRIQDTDFAAETASLTRGQILQQAGTAMLAQANSLPNGVLSLLRG